MERRTAASGQQPQPAMTSLNLASNLDFYAALELSFDGIVAGNSRHRFRH